MRLSIQPLLLLALPLVAAVFKDEVGQIDFHHALLGIPNPATTFFHRPRKDDKASLLYTLGDVGVLGAVNPATGAVVWRHEITNNGNGHLRAPEGEDWVAAAGGAEVQAWNALSGRSIWQDRFKGEVKDLEIMEFTEKGRKDVLVLFEEDDGVTVLRRLDGSTGAVVWEFREQNKLLPLQVSNNVANVYVISLQGSTGAYSLKVTSLDTLTGSRVDDYTVGAKGEVQAPIDVMFVGANSAAPLLTWTDASLAKLSVHVLGTKGKQEIHLAEDTVSVDIQAPHLIQSQPHFLVHSKSLSGNRAEVYHTDLKTGKIHKAYELPHLKSQSAFSTSSDGANVYFTRITEDDVTIFSSESPAVLQRFPVKRDAGLKPVHAVTEVVKKAGGRDFAVRSAVATAEDNWTLVRNGELDWIRPEGLSGTVAAVYAEIPEVESLAKVLEQEAHTNPFSAYVHRVNRHLNDLQYLPGWLASVPGRVVSSITGGDVVRKDMTLRRDTFGFNKIIVLATRRGRFYGLDTGNNGKIIWSVNVFPQATGESIDIKGLIAKDTKGIVTARGSKGEYVDMNAATGEILMLVAGGPAPLVFSTAAIESEDGVWLLSLGQTGKPLEAFSAEAAPKGTVVIRGEGETLKGLTYSSDGNSVTETESWTFKVKPGQRIVNIAHRPAHDPVASIGRVLGDRSVHYKYLNPNTIVLSIINDEASSLSIQLLDTVTGQILTSQIYDGVDAGKAVSCTISENWYSCAFFGQYTLTDNSDRSIKGYQVVTSDLYEAATPNSRGSLGDAESFSSLNPVDTPTGPPLPYVLSQSWITNQPLTSLAVTQTRQGITNRFLMAYMPEAHAIVGIPRQALDPRRPVGRDPTPAEQEAEGLMKYWPSMEIDPRSIVSHERDVVGIESIIAAPAVVESTGHVLGYGVDVFGTRVAPSGTFDILGRGFGKGTLVLTVVALFAGVVGLGPMVRRKQINARWEAPN